MMCRSVPSVSGLIILRTTAGTDQGRASEDERDGGYPNRMAVPIPPATCPSRNVRYPDRVNQKEDAVIELNRDQVHKELLAAPSSYRRLIDAATPARLRQRTDGTRWTNQAMLFHLLLGYLIVHSLLPLVSLLSRLPPWVGRGFAAMLDATARPFHMMNYVGSVLGGHTLHLPRMARMFDRACAALARRLDRSTDADLACSLPFPKRWDPFFTDHMSLLDLYHYALQHFEYHRRQLTLDVPNGPGTG